MKILYSHRIQSHDGQGVHLDALVTAIRALGHDVRVVGPGLFEKAGLGGESRFVAWIRRTLPSFAVELLELAYSIPCYVRLARVAREFQPDAIYERYNLFYLAGALLACRRRLPFLVEVNAPLAEERARYSGLSLRRMARWSEAYVWRQADHVLPVTAVLAHYVAAAGVPRDRIKVIHNGIDLAQFAAPVADPGAHKKVTLGFVGFVRTWHGLDHVIRTIAAWHGDPPLALRVVGDGPARPDLEILATELGVSDRVQFTGLTPRARIPELVAGFDIALQPASVQYASPLKVFEYMAAGRAIVAPDQPNIREILEDGKTALLFDPERPNALRDCVLRLAADATLRSQLGDEARAAVRERDFTWVGNAHRVIALVQEASALPR